MFPYTSDDGFSIVDYLEINRNLGTWDNIKDLSKNQEVLYVNKRSRIIIRNNEKTKSTVVYVNVSRDTIKLKTEYEGTNIINQQKVKEEIIILCPYEFV